MMEVEESEKIDNNEIKTSTNDIIDLVPTNNTNSYIKIIKELNYDIFPKYEYFNFKKENYMSNNKEVPKEDIGIIIDNGSYECRAGWSICNEPNKRYLTYTEFILCCINIGDILTPEKLINAFFFFDMDNNLVIDSTDLKNVLLRCGKSVINEKDIDKILLEATKEKDNKIGIEEFIKMYKDDIDVDEYINAINILLENNKDIRNFL